MNYHDTVKEAMAIALSELIQEYVYEDITIKQIVRKAGVSRSSFYRAFNNKEEVLRYYITLINQNNNEDMLSKPDNIKEYTVSTLKDIKKYKPFFSLLKAIIFFISIIAKRKRKSRPCCADCA